MAPDRPPAPALALAFVMSALTGCTAFPNLSAQVSPEAQSAAFPELVPILPIVEALPPVADGSVEAAALEARAGAARGRAEAVSGPVIDDETQRRLQAAAAAQRPPV